MIRSIVCFAILTAIIGAGAPAWPEDLPEGMIVVRYGFEIDGWKPVTGEAFCRLDSDCQIGFDFDPVRLTLHLTAMGGDRLDIACPDQRYDCSLDASPSGTFEHGKRAEHFSIYYGHDSGLSRELVIRYRQKLGNVFLLYRVPDRSLKCNVGRPLMQCPKPT